MGVRFPPSPVFVRHLSANEYCDGIATNIAKTSIFWSFAAVNYACASRRYEIPLCYILRSPTDPERYYVGIAEDVEHRLKSTMLDNVSTRRGLQRGGLRWPHHFGLRTRPLHSIGTSRVIRVVLLPRGISNGYLVCETILISFPKCLKQKSVSTKGQKCKKWHK